MRGAERFSGIHLEVYLKAYKQFILMFGALGT